MPQAVPFILSAAVSASALTGWQLILAYLAVAAISNALVDKDSGEGQPTPKTMSQNPIQYKSIVYGKAELSGPLVFAGNTSSNTMGAVVALTGHPVERINTITIGEYTFSIPESYKNLDTREVYLQAGPFGAGGFGDNGSTRLWGVTGQDPDDVEALSLRDSLGIKWSQVQQGDAINSPMKLNDIAYMAYLIRTDTTDWTAMPSFKASVSGKLVRDPIDMYNIQQASGDPLTSVPRYSSGWSDCILDYLMDPYLGLGVPITEIDLLYWKLAAETSNELLTSDSGSSIYPRYECNGVLSTGDSLVSNVEKMLTAGFGTLVYTQGKYRLFAGEYQIPSAAEEDVIREEDLAGPVKLRVSVPRSERFNAVTGTYIDIMKYGGIFTKLRDNFSSKDFPEVKNETYRLADIGTDTYDDALFNGYLPKDISLPFTGNPHTAQRIANITLNVARQGLILDIQVKPKGIRYSVGDNVKVDFPTLVRGVETNPGFVSAVLGNVVSSGGLVTSIPISNGGAGYLYPPSIAIQSSGTDAVAFCVIDQGSIIEVIIASAGTGYSNSDTASLSDPTSEGLAWVDKVFKIENWAPKEDGTIALTLREDASVSYDAFVTVDTDLASDVELVDEMSGITPRDLVLFTGDISNTSTDGTWVSSINAQFQAGLLPNLVKKYEIQIGSGSTDYIELDSLSVAAALEDPVSSLEYTAVASFVLKTPITEASKYANVYDGAIGAFDFNINVNTAALPEYEDKRNNFQDFGEESII